MDITHFAAGTDKQIQWASALRLKFARLLDENGYALEDIHTLIVVK